MVGSYPSTPSDAEWNRYLRESNEGPRQLNNQGFEQRFYPSQCLSSHCGHIKCPADCSGWTVRQQFKNWSERVKAVQPDPIWSPCLWVATIKETL